MGFKQTLRQLWNFRKTLIVLIAPVLYLPVVIFYPSKAGRCGYAVLIIASYWVTEAIPIAVTALLPMVLMPWLGVLGSNEVCSNYLKDTNVLFMGGLIVAVAVEKWNLHKRVALRVLLTLGSEPKWLILGFMISTAFLSMWISNTATAAMMVPIAEAVLLELEIKLEKEPPEMMEMEDEGAADEKATNTDPNVLPLTADKDGEQMSLGTTNFRSPDNGVEMFRNLAKGMCLCVACAANIGGTSTLTGTGPNLVFKGHIDMRYGSDAGINFSTWFIYAFPNMIISLFAAWVWMVSIFVGVRDLFSWRKKKSSIHSKARGVLLNEYRKLGPVSFAEKAVLFHFIVLVTLWFTRDPGFTYGWGYFLEDGYVTDACVAITVCISLFVFPSERPKILCCGRRTGTNLAVSVPSLLDWPTLHRKLAWGVVLVIGGGFAIANSCEESGLSSVISDFFTKFKGFPAWILVLILCTITALFTEVTSNVAVGTICMPILAQLASTLRINPLYLLIPVTLSTSFAFMLPVATPPNAIVFAYGRLKILDMVKSGAVLNIICLLIAQLSINSWGYALFNLGTFPDWAESRDNQQNTTMAGIPGTTVSVT